MASAKRNDGQAERDRLTALHAMNLLDTAPLASLDQITRLASQLFGTPISLITMMDAHRQWFKSSVGMGETRETSRADSFCHWTIEGQSVMVVEDATQDPRFAASSLVTGKPNIVFYAGAPLVLSSGHALGSLCVIDTKPRSFSLLEQEQLATLASLAMAQIDLHQRAGRVHEVTRLPNRAQLIHDLQDESSQFTISGGMVLIDLMGHQRVQAAVRAVGISRLERILCEISAKLRTTVGASWPIYHVSETRFCMPLRGINVAEHERFVNQVLSELKSPFYYGGVSVELAPRAGLVTCRPCVGNAADSLRRALSALYEAGARGQDYLWHEDAFDASHQRGYRLLQDVMDGLTQGNFRLVYQPKLNLRLKRITGVEALARWVHPELGNISPGEFIPLIEETPLIKSFSRWVLQAAVEQLAQWRKDGIDLTVAINVSPKNLVEPDFVEQVRMICIQHALPPEKLHIECTETAVMTKQETRVALTTLQKMGVQISLDDFGMGYSNLACLRELPVQLLKLDQSLIKPVEKNNRALDLVKSLIMMGHSLGYRMLAEGVETEAVFDLIKRAGCDAIQGYYFSRPLEDVDVPRFISDNNPLPKHLCADDTYNYQNANSNGFAKIGEPYLRP